MVTKTVNEVVDCYWCVISLLELKRHEFSILIACY